MSRSVANVHPERLRRLVLSRQGLTRDNAFGRGRGAVLQALTHLGYVQIDTISVVARAHHHVLRSRVDNYQPAMLDGLVHQRSAFEYWFHAAAYLPMADYRYALPRMEEIRRGVRKHWGGRRDRKLERAVLDRIGAEGPLAAKDFEGNGKGGGWWDWKPAKGALEVLFMQGDLMVTERTGFQKRYDLRERVLPDNVNTTTPTTTEYAEHLLSHALRNFAAVTVPEATYLRRSAPLRKALQQAIDERVAAGALLPANLASGYQTFVETQALEQRSAKRSNRLRILSPFDNLVIQRKRTAALFDFDYLIECYVPAPKRQYGYFCLPLLWGDRFVGRMDCKVHRSEGLLEIKSLHLEEGAQPVDAWSEALARALENYLAFNQATHLKLPAKLPTSLRKDLRRLT